MKTDAVLQFKLLLDDLKVTYVMEYVFKNHPDAKEIRATLSPDLQKEFNRPFRFDFAVVDRKIAFEIDGAIWTNGRHTRGKGFSRDCKKIDIAQYQGWRVYRFPTTWFIHHKRKKYQEYLMYYEDLREMVKNIVTSPIVQ